MTKARVDGDASTDGQDLPQSGNEVASAFTPGPWRVVTREYRHRKGSPICPEKCGAEKPIRIEHETAEEAVKNGYRETELHVMGSEDVEDVIAADGSHVVCFGHDYDDYGSVGFSDARLIAAAPDLYAALKAIVQGYDGPTVDAATAVSSYIQAARMALKKAEVVR